MAKVCVFLACSLDGYIAGPNNDLTWLKSIEGMRGDREPSPKGVDFAAHLDRIGCPGGEHPYGETPILVATTRPLSPGFLDVEAVQGTISEVLARASAIAGDHDIYVDGGKMVRQALHAGLLDELILTIAPLLLGKGTRLFDGLAGCSRLQFFGQHPVQNGMLLQDRVLHD